MAGSIGVGLKVPHEPTLMDGGSLPPGSWDIILETGIGADALMLSERDLKLLIETA
tara:strand:- start:1478 stop:1645 length:168 start_codon:yes stop_codon:yes gene_type:complete